MSAAVAGGSPLVVLLDWSAAMWSLPGAPLTLQEFVSRKTC
jgi:hypothetical protein